MSSLSDMKTTLSCTIPPVRLCDPDTGFPLADPETLLKIGKAVKDGDMKTLGELMDQIMDIGADEVHPRIFVGNMKAAQNSSFLKSKGIHTIFNMAHGEGLGFFTVTEEQLDGLKYFGYRVTDTGSEEKTALEAVDKIHKTLSESSGKILINCVSGIDRSSTTAILYLVLKENIKPVDALKQVKSQRDVRPSDKNIQMILRLAENNTNLTVSDLEELFHSVEAPVRLMNRKTGLIFIEDPEIEKRILKAYKEKDYQTCLKIYKDIEFLSADEVAPRIFVGNKLAAENVSFLKSNGIKTIINMAHGEGLGFYKVDTEMLGDISYFGFGVSHEGSDETVVKEAVEQLKKSLNETSGNVLVSCYGGIDRSSTTVMLYFMLKENKHPLDLLRSFRQKRDVQPIKKNLEMIVKVYNENRA